VNDAPVASAQSVTTAEDTPKAITLAATDVEGDPLTYSIVAGPTHGTLSGTAPAVIYTPAANYNGADSFTFRANDGIASSNVATVTITVTAVNDAPVATGDSYTTAEDSPLTVAAPGVLGNDSDVDGDVLTAVLVSGPAHGTLTLNANGSFTFTPAANYNGPDTFQYQARDPSAALSSTVTVGISISAVNDAPSFAKGADQTVAQDSGVKTVTGWATAISAGPADESGQTLNFIVTNDNAALFSVQPAVASNGTLTFTPAAGASGLAHVTIQLHDDGGTANGGIDTSAPQTFVITVSAAGPPKLSIASVSVTEGNGGCAATTPMPFVVTLSAPWTQTVTVSYQTLNGTASGDSSCTSRSKGYITQSGTLTFAPGETSKTVIVQIVGDTTSETSQTLSVKLSNPINATILKAEGIGTIIDDDP